jgi:hypothetical protein
MGLRRGAFLCFAWLAQTGGRTVIFYPKRRQENQLGSIVAMMRWQVDRDRLQLVSALACLA